MVLAAGLGTRLRPLTNERPKALVEINGRTLLEITLARLRRFGVHEVIINTHHFADVLLRYLEDHNNFGMQIQISREDDLLLDTGGGLKKAAKFFQRENGDTPFIVHNVDVLSTIDLHEMVALHRKHDALATLAMRDRKSSRLLLFNSHSELCGRQLAKDGAPVTEMARACLGGATCPAPVVHLLAAYADEADLEIGLPVLRVDTTLVDRDRERVAVR